MIECKTEKIDTKVPVSVTCDVCKKTYDCKKDEMEVQEFHYIRFTGGYSSVFGDGVTMQADICQHCLNKKLGEYLTVDEGD